MPLFSPSLGPGVAGLESDARSARGPASVVVAAIAAFFALRLIAPFVPLPSAPAAIAGGVLLTLLYVGAIVGGAWGLARLHLKPSTLAILAILGAALWAAAHWWISPALEQARVFALESGAQPSRLQLLASFYGASVQDYALVATAMCGGALLARLIRYPNLLGPIGAVIALVDIWGVLLGGVVSQLLENEATAPLAERALTSGPTLGAATAPSAPGAPVFTLALPSIGVGDFFFIALLLGALANLGMRHRAAAWWIWALVCPALLLITADLIPALPGLLFIGAGALGPNIKFFSYTREERFALLWAGLLVVVLTAGLYFAARALLPTSGVPGA